MRLLLANPNTTAAVTAHIAAAARSIAAPGTEIMDVTGPFGAAVIATRADIAVGEHASVTMLGQHAPGCDAAIIGASLDSGMRAAREMLPIPVIGITEAALHAACLMGTRFGVITLSAHSATITEELIRAYGLATRLAGLQWLESTALDLLAAPDDAVPGLARAAGVLVRQHRAEVVVLIGAVMAGMPARLQPHVAVPVIEGVTCAVPFAEALARLRPR